MTARARFSDPETSHRAAATVQLKPNQTAVMLVMRILGRPVLDEELIAEYQRMFKALGLPQQSPSGLRSRRSELERAGRLVRDEKKRMSTGGLGLTFRIVVEDQA